MGHCRDLEITRRLAERIALSPSGNLIPVGEVPKRLSKRQNAFCEIRLVDADDCDVPLGTPGELAFRGLTLFSGYWNAPETATLVASSKARSLRTSRSSSPRSEGDNVRVVTSYRPDPGEWQADLKARRPKR